jgi:hypothetical protein
VCMEGATLVTALFSYGPTLPIGNNCETLTTDTKY